MKRSTVRGLSQKDSDAIDVLSRHQWEKGCDCSVSLCEMSFLHDALSALVTEYKNRIMALSMWKRMGGHESDLTYKVQLVRCERTLSSVRAMEKLLGTGTSPLQ